MGERLTGKRRYRTKSKWCGEPTIVLQVQVECDGMFWSGGSAEVERWLEWRDARVGDLTLHDVLQ